MFSTREITSQEDEFEEELRILGFNMWSFVFKDGGSFLGRKVRWSVGLERTMQDCESEEEMRWLD